MEDQAENDKILASIYNEDANVLDTSNSTFNNETDESYELPIQRNLRQSGGIYDVCGCNGSCKRNTPAYVSVSTYIDHCGEDSGLIDPWPNIPLRVGLKQSSHRPRKIHPVVVKTLIANVSMEQVSFPEAIRSMVRYGNYLLGQNWVLPKSL